VLADQALEGLHGLVTGGNEHDIHLTGVQPGRDFACEWVDVRAVEPGDTCLGARYLDEQGHEQLIWMGSYGIGPARIVAAAIEQFADDSGICWPRGVAPFDIELVTLGKEGEEARAVSDRLYDELRELGLEVLYDDRALNAGEKFADAELLGCPLRLTVGRKSVEAREIDVQVRRGQERRSLPLEGGAEAAVALWQTLP